LSAREEVRIGATISFAVVKIQSRLGAGELPRTDGFFERDESGRSDSDSIYEGVLLKAKNEIEEKKLRFMGNLIASIAFNPDISPTVAHFYLTRAEALSYRQLCFLALVAASFLTVNFLSLDGLTNKLSPLNAS